MANERPGLVETTTIVEFKFRDRDPEGEDIQLTSAQIAQIVAWAAGTKCKDCPRFLE